jgi:hypothetical protein
VRRRLLAPVTALVLAGALAASCASPPAAQAFNPVKPICSLAGLVSTLAGKVCSASSHLGRALKAGKKLLGGHLGGALKSLSGAGGAAKALTYGAALAAVGAWVLDGAKLVLHDTAAVIGSTTRPQLESTWFSASYWRMAGVSALLTLPFLFAAAIQALLRSDPALLARSALGYLPLGLLAVAVAAPVTMLLLSASDELSAIVSSASGSSDVSFLARAGALTSAVSGLSHSTFLLFSVGLLAVAATLTLWVELLIRSAAVYVIVLMLPLFFSAFVWPARKVWAVRAVELLVALILSKFAIVAVLALGGAALGHTAVPSATQLLEGTTLVMLAAFSPWALLRLLPLHELAGGLHGLRSQGRPPGVERSLEASEIAQELMSQLPTAWPSRTSGPAGESGAARAAIEGLARSSGSNAAGDGAEQAGASQAAAASRSETSTAPAERAGADPSEASTAGQSEPSTAAPGDPSSGDPSSGGAPDTAVSPGPRERSPGLDHPVYQAPDRSLEFVLGPESLPPHPPPEPDPATDQQPPGEDHDPLPPPQEPEGGAL